MAPAWAGVDFYSWREEVLKLKQGGAFNSRYEEVALDFIPSLCEQEARALG